MRSRQPQAGSVDSWLMFNPQFTLLHWVERSPQHNYDLCRYNLAKLINTAGYDLKHLKSYAVSKIAYFCSYICCFECIGAFQCCVWQNGLFKCLDWVVDLPQQQRKVSTVLQISFSQRKSMTLNENVVLGPNDVMDLQESVAATKIS